MTSGQQFIYYPANETRSQIEVIKAVCGPRIVSGRSDAGQPGSKWSWMPDHFLLTVPSKLILGNRTFAAACWGATVAARVFM
jgi:hypothetical protein